MYEKSNVKTNIIRYYFVAIHPVHKATSGIEGQDWGRDTDECIHNLHTHMCDGTVQKKHVLASPTYQHFYHSQSRVMRDSMGQHVSGTQLRFERLSWVSTGVSRLVQGKEVKDLERKKLGWQKEVSGIICSDLAHAPFAPYQKQFVESRSNDKAGRAQSTQRVEKVTQRQKIEVET